MRKFIITSAKLSGRITLLYRASGVIHSITNESDISPIGWHLLIGSIPYDTCSIFRLQENHPTLTLTEQQHELTFAEFYSAYGNKVAKKRAEAKWDKLSPAQQMAAYLHIDKYKSQLKQHSWKSQMQPDTYLEKEPWND